MITATYKYIYINVYLTILTVSGYAFKLWKESVNSDGQQSTNINKTNSDLSSQIIDIWRWKSSLR